MRRRASKSMLKRKRNTSSHPKTLPFLLTFFLELQSTLLDSTSVARELLRSLCHAHDAIVGVTTDGGTTSLLVRRRRRGSGGRRRRRSGRRRRRMRRRIKGDGSFRAFFFCFFYTFVSKPKRRRKRKRGVVVGLFGYSTL